MAWILASKDQLLGGLARGNASYRGFFSKIRTYPVSTARVIQKK